MKLAYTFVLWSGLFTATLSFSQNICRSVTEASGDKIDEAWEKVGFRYEMLSAMVNNTYGFQSQEHFLMAVKALNSLLASREPQLFLIPKDFRSSEFPPGKIVGSVGGFQIYEIEKRTDIRPFWNHLRPQFQRIYQENQKVDFEEVFKWAVNSADPARAAVLTAQAFNDALLESDAHAHLDPIELVKEEQSSKGEEFAGIGIQLDRREGIWKVAGFLPDGPAEVAGLKERDEILEIDGLKVHDTSEENLFKRFSGKPNEPVYVTVRRGARILTLSILRQVVFDPLAMSRTIRGDGGTFGYLKVEEIQSPALISQVRKAVEGFHRNGAKGIVIDLRWNRGGTIQVTLDFISLFIGPTKQIGMTLDIRTGVKTVLPTTLPKITDLPLLVLVNHRSCSGAEFAAAALQQTKRAYLVGNRTFGKGTAQAPYSPGSPFKGYPVFLYETESIYYVTPGLSPQWDGVPPDFAIPWRPQPSPEEMKFEYEGDLYPTAYENPGAPLEVPKRKERDLIQACLRQTGTAERAYYSTRHGDINPKDFQLLSAADIMRCLWRL